MIKNSQNPFAKLSDAETKPPDILSNVISEIDVIIVCPTRVY